MTLAFTTMAGFSMSALLWTILSSSCAGLGLFPGPATSGKQTAVQRKEVSFNLSMLKLKESILSWAVYKRLNMLFWDHKKKMN